MAKIKSKLKKSSNVSPFKDYWKKNNYILFGLGIGIIILGFILMAQGPWDNPISLSYAPIVLLVAYVIVFPIAILYRKKKTVLEDVPSKS